MAPEESYWPVDPPNHPDDKWYGMRTHEERMQDEQAEQVTTEVQYGIPDGDGS